MGSDQPFRAAERLERLFAIIVEEAKARPDFAVRLLECISADPLLEDGGSSASDEQPSALSSFSLVAVLHNDGEERLRDCLRIIPSKEQLLRLAEEQHIPINEEVAATAALPAVIDAIVEGVKFRLNERMAASL